MKRAALFAVVLASCIAASPLMAAAVRPDLPPPAPEMPYSPVFCAARNISAGFGVFDGVHTARRGDLIVPPRDYASGLHSPQAPRLDEAGIYDIAFLGIDGEDMMLELRDYLSPEAREPVATRIFSYPAATRSIQLRHIVLSIQSASELSIVYRSAIAAAVADDAVSTDEDGPTEQVVNDYCRLNGMPAIDVAGPR
ncbi:hypothetical protein V474_16145 [Novosphingobium barchaimii LL02]|uniref:DUF1254 domain-containing protein n=1 Tax=Novosphingobium barchaimii LL02 TaxID=1114963 RepID=A0A0J7XYD6_9SPHN|nr:hypothetical protein [Novosphingobium barchaimii]KMS56686.1 hypothetical protein V474_16145 [Novosphingobium barchaimii LL02]